VDHILKTVGLEGVYTLDLTFDYSFMMISKVFSSKGQAATASAQLHCGAHSDTLLLARAFRLYTFIIINVFLENGSIILVMVFLENKPIIFFMFYFMF